MITRDNVDFDKLHEALRTTYNDHIQLKHEMKVNKVVWHKNDDFLSVRMTELCLLMAFVKGRTHIDKMSLGKLAKYGIMHSRFPADHAHRPNEVAFYGTNNIHYITDDNGRLLMNEYLCQRIFGDLWKEFVKEEVTEVAV